MCTIAAQVFPQTELNFMAIKNLITHRLCKSSPTSQGEIQLRQSELDLNGKTEELCRELKNNYIRKAGKTYGCFSEDTAEHPLSPLLLEFLEEKISFVSLCTKFMTHLKLQMDKVDSPLDNRVIFFFEQSEAGDAFYVFLVDHSSGQYFDGELNLCDVIYLDTQSINLAAKVKIPELLAGDQQNYLSLLRWRGEKELSDAFAETMGFANKVDVAADTSQFLELVTHYTRDLPDEQAKETRQQVVEYCLEQDKSGHPVAIQALSQQISHEHKPPFADFVKATIPQSKTQLIPDKTQLRNYVRISGRDEQLSMSFASACLGDTVVYNADSDSITIRNIPASLKAKLVQHLKHKTEE